MDTFIVPKKFGGRKFSAVFVTFTIYEGKSLIYCCSLLSEGSEAHEIIAHIITAII